MSGLRRFTQHPDRQRNPHEQARRLASDALLEPLGDLDAAWLEDHLAGCEPCALEVEGYAADVLLLRGLRDAPPPVPRDLGARVSLSLDDELRRSVRRRGASPRRPRSVRLGGRPAWAGGAFAGVVVAALVAVLVLPMGLLPGATPATVPPDVSPLPAATPIAVDTQPVAWMRRGNDGRYVISSATVDQVCAGPDASSCGTLDGGARTVAALDVRPSSFLLPRDGSPAVVVGNDTVYAVTVNAEPPVTSPEPDPSPVASIAPAQSPAAPGASASPPADTPAPSVAPAATEPSSPEPVEPGASVDPSPPASPEPVEPTPTPAAGASPTPAAGASPTPAAGASPTPATEPTPAPTSAPTPAGVPSPTPAAEPTPAAAASTAPATPLPTMPPPTPAPTAEAVLAIAEGIVLVGAPPAYSPDGKWVAFSARPRDGTRGPDVYVWRVGDRRARSITEDHGSVFAGWLGDRILASTARFAESPEREPGDGVPPGDADPATVAARSFTIDPAGRSVTVIPREGIWRPVVDPTDRLAVYWTGSLAWNVAAQAWLPAEGVLVAADWRTVLDPAADAATRPLPAAAGSETTSFEVRFDPSGRRFAVWTADTDAPGAGWLALVAVTETGSVGDVILSGVGALPGFSLDADRLAWSTPPGRNGAGSHVTVYAWSGEHAGQVYSLPDAGDEPVVVAP